MYHGSGGGHYTSYILSEPSQQNNGSASKKQELWLRCNDSMISRIEKPDLISKDAYILFYKRKEFTTSNIINMTAPAF
jgi:ubiquitin C-terminal hydrolase